MERSHGVISIEVTAVNKPEHAVDGVNGDLVPTLTDKLAIERFSLFFARLYFPRTASNVSS
jgi:hypothetical protein